MGRSYGKQTPVRASVPEWVRALPIDEQMRLIAEQQRVFNYMMQQQTNPYLNGALNMRYSRPPDIYIAGQVIDGVTGALKHACA